jgi:hypothetical protein
MTTQTLISGSTYSDADPAAEAAAKAAAEERVTADPTVDDKPANWPAPPQHSTLIDGVVVDADAQ